MREKVFESYKDLEKQLGEEGAMSNAKFIFALYEDASEKWEAELKAVRSEIETLRTILFIILAVIPLSTALIVFLGNLLEK